MADAALVPLVAVYGVSPSLLVLVTIVWLLVEAASPWRVVEAAALGLAFDLNSGGHAGAGLAAFSLMSFCLMHARPVLRRLGPVEQACCLVPIVAAMLLIVGVLNRACGEAVPPPRLIVLRSIGCACYTAAIGLPIFMVLDWRRATGRARLFRF